MEKFSSRQKKTTKKTRVIWDAKSVTVFESILHNKELNAKLILKFICDPKAPFIQQEIKKTDGNDKHD